MNSAAKELISRSHFGTPAFSLNGCNSDLQSLAASMCEHPIKVIGRDHYNAESRYYYAPCGTCNNCRNTKGNELTARFYHDATILKHAYFITLTYPSYVNSHDIPDTLRPCFWHLDRYNTDNKLLWSPCLLYYPHIQSFNKLLRTRLTRHFGVLPYLEIITTGELGHRFGRPHWHMLIISDKELTKIQIEKSWTDTIKAESRIDFVDIIQNGTLEARPDVANPIRATKKNVKHCVKYLVKYTQKSDIRLVNTTRLNYALDYFRGIPMDDEMLTQLVDCKNILFTPTNFHYDKTQTLFKIPRGQKSSRLSGYQDITLRDLYVLFGTKHQSSTTNAIGKLYALQNRERFAAGNLKTKPVPSFTPTMSQSNCAPRLKQQQSCIFPQYYSKLTERYVFPLCSCKKTSKGTIQYRFITSQDSYSCRKILSSLSSPFPICRDSLLFESCHKAISCYADFDMLGIELPQELDALFFPSNLSHNKLTNGDTSNYYTTGYLYNRETHTRYIPFTLYDLVNGLVVPISFCFCSQRYEHGEWTSPVMVDLDVILHDFVDIPLEQRKHDYMIKRNEMDTFVSLMDAIHDSEELRNARDINSSNWQSLKINKSNQTKLLNPYD